MVDQIVDVLGLAQIHSILNKLGEVSLDKCTSLHQVSVLGWWLHSDQFRQQVYQLRLGLIVHIQSQVRLYSKCTSLKLDSVNQQIHWVRLDGKCTRLNLDKVRYQMYQVKIRLGEVKDVLGQVNWQINFNKVYNYRY